MQYFWLFSEHETTAMSVGQSFYKRFMATHHAFKWLVENLPFGAKLTGQHSVHWYQGHITKYGMKLHMIEHAKKNPDVREGPI